MYFEFYIDRFFAEQLLTDYLLLNAAAVFCREKANGRRMAAGSLAGAAVTIAALLSGMPDFGLAGLAAASAAAFWKKNLRAQWKHNLSCTAAVLFLTVCFGGTLEALLSLAGLPLLAGVVLSFVLLRAAFHFFHRRMQDTGHLVQVTLILEGRSRELQALIDTGNRLRAPVTGRPVSIVSKSAVETLLTKDYLERRGICMIPYHSLGIGTGWMKGITLDKMRVSTPEGGREIKSPLIALYEGNISMEGSWQMILHPEHTPQCQEQNQ